jgi:hypothetical protein
VSGKGRQTIDDVLNFSPEIKLIRPLDFVLFACLAVAAAWSAVRLTNSEGSHADIFVRDRKTARLSLSGEAKTIRIPSQIGDFRIRYGKNGIKVESSPCRLKICLHHGIVSRPHQRIICVPGRLVIVVSGSAPKGEKQLDGVVF